MPSFCSTAQGGKEEQTRIVLKHRSWVALTMPYLKRALSTASRHKAVLLFLVVFGGVAMIGAIAAADLKAANAEAQKMYSGSVHGLQQIGEMQYDAQETRRATLYALTTSDSNLQFEYAGQSHSADRRVRQAIDQYSAQAQQPAEVLLSDRLTRDWSAYLDVRDQVLAKILNGNARQAVGLDLTAGVPAFERVRQDLSQVKRLYDQDASRRLSNLAASAHRTYWRLSIILGITFLLACAAVWLIQRNRLLSAIQLAKLQMEFVASVSHELRTPLAVLSSAADNIADGLVEDQTALRRYGAMVQKQSRRMGELIDQILMFASTEDGTHRFVLQPLELAPILDAAVCASEKQAVDAGMVLDRQIDEDLPPVMGDAAGISQCVQNLIANAIKYGGGRRVAVHAYAIETQSADEVRVSVTDRGMGIDAAELRRIFEPFYRSPRVQAAQIPGTGLGLPLARRIAEAMGGELTVTSKISEGSTFTLHLQIARMGNTLAAASLPAQSSRR